MTDIQHLTLLAILMTVCGLAGGLVNYWDAPRAQVQAESHPLLKRLAAGVAASLAVPLFLNMIASTLIADSKSDPLELLVFAGFCIVAAISSKAFIDSLSNRLLNRMERLDTALKSLREEVEPLIAKEREPAADRTSAVARYDLSAADNDILQALASPDWSMRPLRGIIEDTGLGDAEALRSLARLCGLGLARKSAPDGTDRWWLTAEGRCLAQQRGAE